MASSVNFAILTAALQIGCVSEKGLSSSNALPVVAGVATKHRTGQCKPATIQYWQTLEKLGAMYELLERTRQPSDCEASNERYRLLAKAAIAQADVKVAEAAVAQCRELLSRSTVAILEKELEGLHTLHARTHDVALAEKHLVSARRFRGQGKCVQAAHEATAARNAGPTNGEASAVLGQAEACLGRSVKARAAFSRSAKEASGKLRWLIRNFEGNLAGWTWSWVRGQNSLCLLASRGQGGEYVQLAGPDSRDGRVFGEPFGIAASREKCCGTPDGCGRPQDFAATAAQYTIYPTDHELEVRGLLPDGSEGVLWVRDLPGPPCYEAPRIVGKRFAAASVFPRCGATHLDPVIAILDLRTGKEVRRLPPPDRDTQGIQEWLENDTRYFIRATAEPAVEGIDLGTGKRIFSTPQSALHSHCGKRREFLGWTERKTMLLHCDRNWIELDPQSGTVRSALKTPDCPNRGFSFVYDWLTPENHLAAWSTCGRPIRPWTSFAVDFDAGAFTRIDTGGTGAYPVVSWNGENVGAVEQLPDGSALIAHINPRDGSVLSSTKISQYTGPQRDSTLLFDKACNRLVFCDKNGDSSVAAVSSTACRTSAASLCSSVLRQNPLPRSNLPDGNVETPIVTQAGKSLLIRSVAPEYVQFLSPNTQALVGHLVYLAHVGWVWSTEGDPDVFNTARMRGNYAQWSSGYTQPALPTKSGWYWCIAGSRVMPDEVCSEALMRDDVFARILAKAE